MSMTMAGCRMEGSMSKNKILRRFQNLLNLTYLQAEPIDGGGYRIPEKIFESIQTELDFTIPDEEEKRKVEEQIKKRYRQRNSYRFWKEALEVANIGNAVDAKEFLLKIFTKLDNTRYYGSMTHSRYALETLELALDDTYGTNKVILSQYKFLAPPLSKKAAKSNHKRRGKKAKKGKRAIVQVNDIPF